MSPKRTIQQFAAAEVEPMHVVARQPDLVVDPYGLHDMFVEGDKRVRYGKRAAELIAAAELVVHVHYADVCAKLGALGVHIDPYAHEVPDNMTRLLSIEGRWDPTVKY